MMKRLFFAGGRAFGLGIWLCLIPTLQAAVDLGRSTAGTPYDPYMGRVRQVLRHTGGRNPSLTEVSELMREGRNFQYSYRRPYAANSPALTEARRAGDCKDKALWLAERMDARQVRFVVGKGRSGARLSHAWLLWRKDGQYYILDCTRTSRPVLASSVPSRLYVPQYSWSAGGTFRHRTRVAAVREAAPQGPTAGGMLAAR